MDKIIIKEPLVKSALSKYSQPASLNAPRASVMPGTNRPPVKLVAEKVNKPAPKEKHLFVRLTPNLLNIEDAIKSFENTCDTLLGIKHNGGPDEKVGEKTEHYHFILTLTNPITVDGFKRRLNALGYFSNTMLNVEVYNPADIDRIGGYLFHETDVGRDGELTDDITPTVNKGYNSEQIKSFREYNKTVKERVRTRKYSSPVWETIQYFRDNNNLSPSNKDIFTAYLRILRRRELPYPGKIRSIINIQTIKLHLCDDHSYPRIVEELYEEIKYNL